MVPSGWVPLGSRLSKRCNGASSHARHAGSRIGDFASPSKSDSPTPRDKRANAEMQAHSTTTTLHASRPCTVARALASRSGRLRSDARPASAIARIVAFAIVCNMPSCRSRERVAAPAARPSVTIRCRLASTWRSPTSASLRRAGEFERAARAAAAAFPNPTPTGCAGSRLGVARWARQRLLTRRGSAASGGGGGGERRGERRPKASGKRESMMVPV